MAARTRQWWTGDLKLLYVALGLALRAREPELLARGSYRPLKVEGPGADHIVAFAREHEGKVLLTVAARWFGSALSAPDALGDLKTKLHDTFIAVSPTAPATDFAKLKFTNVLTGAAAPAETQNGPVRMRAGEVLAGLPAVWLIADQNA